jgi:hypothetical protein
MAHHNTGPDSLSENIEMYVLRVAKRSCRCWQRVAKNWKPVMATKSISSWPIRDTVL